MVVYCCSPCGLTVTRAELVPQTRDWEGLHWVQSNYYYDHFWFVPPQVENNLQVEQRNPLTPPFNYTNVLIVFIMWHVVRQGLSSGR